MTSRRSTRNTNCAYGQQHTDLQNLQPLTEKCQCRHYPFPFNCMPHNHPHPP